MESLPSSSGSEVSYIFTHQDHVGASVIFTTQAPASLLQYRVSNIPSALQYALLGTGPLASLGGVEGIAFVNTTYGRELMTILGL